MFYYFSDGARKIWRIWNSTGSNLNMILKLTVNLLLKLLMKPPKTTGRTDQPIKSPIMPENKNDYQCPVCSFKMYLSHLHPRNQHLWQTPNHKPKDPTSNIWYTKAHLSKSPLGGFFGYLSDKIGTKKRLYQSLCRCNKCICNHLHWQVHWQGNDGNDRP